MEKKYGIESYLAVTEMNKPTILIIIDDLAKGGAEILLAGILPDLDKRYQVVLVTLTDRCDFQKDELVYHQKYTLGFNNKLSLFSSVIRLKKIIQKHKPSFVHSHLLYSSIIARLACPKQIPLLYSIHSIMSENTFNKSRLLTWLEKNSIKNSHTLIAVSNEALKDYIQTIKAPATKFILKNYTTDMFLKKGITKTFPQQQERLKLVAVGNIKIAKNYIYLVEAFKLLKGYNISLDIYGKDQGNLLTGLEAEVVAHGLPVSFKGRADNVDRLLGNYDMYVMPSKYEGFGLAAIEAAALGLPLLLSNLPTLHEVTFNNALFFDLKNPESFAGLIREIFAGKHDLNQFSKKGVELVNDHYTKEKYLAQLFAIYDNTALYTLA